MGTLKEYLLIKFVSGTTTTTRKIAIDCTRSAWVSLCPERGCLVTKFLGPPYDKESNELLDSLLKLKADAPQDWPTYPIEVKGQADTYEEAMVKLKRLEVAEFVFTTDSEAEPKKRAALIETNLKTRQPTLSVKALEAMNSVPPMESDSEHYQTDGSSTDNETSESTILKISKKSDKSNSRSHKLYNEKTKKRKQPTLTAKSLPPLKKAKNDSKPSTSTSPGMLKTRWSNETEGKSTHNSSGSVPVEKNKNRGSVIDRNQETGIARRKNQSNDHDQNLNKNEVPIDEKKKRPVKNDDFSLILLALKGLAADTQAILSNQRQILLAQGNTGLVKEQLFIDKHKIQLPFRTQREFVEFNRKLETDDEFRTEFSSSLAYLFDRDLNLSKSVTNMFKKYLGRSVITRYTVKKKVTGKELMKETRFYEYISDAIIKTHKRSGGRPVTEDMVCSAVGKVLNNAKDWEGERQRRAILQQQRPEVPEGPDTDEGELEDSNTDESN